MEPGPTRTGAPDIRDRWRLVIAALVWLLVAACTDSASGDRPVQATSQPTSAVARNYWPTVGWRTAAPKDHGMDAKALAEIENQVAKGYTTVRSVLVVRDGYLVYERYWQGLDKNSGHDVRSVTKSVIGALVGITLAEGKIKSLEQTVGELLPNRFPPDADPRFARVTVKQLLTMTSGLAGDDPSAGGDAILEDALWKSPDWVRHILGRRLDTDPGTRFAYSNATSHLLSAIVATASGQSTLAFARAKLFGPLGIRTEGAFEPVLSHKIEPSVIEAYERASVAWPVDPQGYHLGGALLRLPAHDLAKIGYLYLNGGRWENKQVIPADYVAAATSPAGSAPNLSMGYGWQWWVAIENGHRVFLARGYGGQYIYVIPDLDLVTVVTSNPEPPGLNPRPLITGTIVPAVRG